MNTAIIVLLLSQIPNSPPANSRLLSQQQASHRAAVAAAESDESPSTPAAFAPPDTSQPLATAKASATGDAPAATPAWLASDGEQQAAAEPLNLSHLALKMFLATAGVLAAAVASIYLGRQWIEQRKPPEPLGRQVRVLETKSLAPRVSLQLVDAAGQMVLVGVDGTGIKGMLRLTGAFEDAWQEATETVADNAE